MRTRCHVEDGGGGECVSQLLLVMWWVTLTLCMQVRAIVERTAMMSLMDGSGGPGGGERKGEAGRGGE